MNLRFLLVTLERWQYGATSFLEEGAIVPALNICQISQYMLQSKGYVLSIQFLTLICCPVPPVYGRKPALNDQ